MIQSHVSGIDGTISELDWNIFSENESDILAIGENALEWDVNGSNVERSGASFGFKNAIKNHPNNVGKMFLGFNRILKY